NARRAAPGRRSFALRVEVLQVASNDRVPRRGASRPLGDARPSPECRSVARGTPERADRAFARMIQVDGLSRSYDGRIAVENLSLTIAPGEILGLVGPNGAGKTTTLRSLAGILAPDRGRILVAGHDLAISPIEATRPLAVV